MDKVKIGKIINTHGINGEVKVLTTTDFPEERFSKGSYVFINNEKLIVDKSRPFKDFWLIKFKYFDNINDIKKFEKHFIFVSKKQKVLLKPGEYLLSQIIGLLVFDLNNDYIGKIVDSFHTKANDVWVVRKQNKKNIFIPFIDQVVKVIDLRKSFVKIDLLEGLDEN